MTALRTKDFLEMSHAMAAMKAADLAYENESLRAKVKSMKAENARLATKNSEQSIGINRLRQQLADAQAREQQLRKAANHVVTNGVGTHSILTLMSVLALPTDSSAIWEYGARLVERLADKLYGDRWIGEGARDAIKSIVADEIRKGEFK